MRIAQFLNSLKIGGAEKLILDSVPLYQKKGIEMDVITLNDAKTPFWIKLEEESNGKLIGLSSKSVYNPLLIFKIIPYLKKYDLIHIHLFPALYWVVLAKTFSFSKTKLIYTEHNTSNRRRNSFIFKFIDQFIYKRLTKIVTIAEEVDKELKKHLSFKKEKFQLIQNGVDVEFYNSALAYPKTDFFTKQDFILIQVSSFRWQKDQNTLIKALELLPKNVKLLLVGIGDLLHESRELVENLNLSERVKFLGIRDDVARLLKTADLIVLSSKHEGLSLSNIEGMSASKPFIGSDVPGLREIVKDYGLLFEQGNAEDLAGKIQKLINNPSFRNQVAEKCYQRAKEFDIHTMVDSYIEVYKTTSNA